MYCVGGSATTTVQTYDPSSGVQYNTTQTAPIGDVYYAPLTSSGIGAWQQGPSYFIPKGAQWFNDVLQLLNQLPSTLFTADNGVTGP